MTNRWFPWDRWSEANDEPHYWRTDYVRYGFFCLRIHRPAYASLSVYANGRQFWASDGPDPLWVWESKARITTWRQWKGREMSMDAALKKALEKLRTKHKVERSRDDLLAANCPVLHAFLTETEGLTKGEGRETGSILLFAKSGDWSACLNDRDTGHTLWANADTLYGLLDAMEKRLTSDNPDWRAKAPQGNYSKAKRKGG